MIKQIRFIHTVKVHIDSKGTIYTRKVHIDKEGT